MMPPRMRLRPLFACYNECLAGLGDDFRVELLAVSIASSLAAIVATERLRPKGAAAPVAQIPVRGRVASRGGQ
jgi:hypothetical protein